MLRRTFRTPGFLAVEAASLGALAFVGSLPWFDAPPPATWPRDAVPYLSFLACCLLGAALIARQSVVVASESVVVQNALLRRRLARPDVRAVRAGNYSGLLNRYGHSTVLHALLITLSDGREVMAYGVIGRHATVDRCARELRAALGLPAAEPAPRHRT